MNTWGSKLKLSIFGESHGIAIGITIDGLPAGMDIDFDLVNNEMQRRAPGNDMFSTKRKEADIPEILSGIVNGKTVGSPICAIIRNENTISSDYQAEIIRPSHADLTAFYRYNGFSDFRGGGHFSGRITAPLVFAGALCKQFLSKHNIQIGARIKQIANISDDEISPIDIYNISKNSFPVYNQEKSIMMQEHIINAAKELNSVGGVIECTALNMPLGIGNPFFGSLESVISSMMFSIPAVKGIEFGDGFKLAELLGSEANDCMEYVNNEIKFLSNHNGGILGGITNGEPIVFRVAIKPTPSIGQKQKTINIKTKETMLNETKGRHDPCIVKRAVSVIEACLAICLTDFLL